jgi:hypothetical protein
MCDLRDLLTLVDLRLVSLCLSSSHATLKNLKKLTNNFYFSSFSYSTTTTTTTTTTTNWKTDMLGSYLVYWFSNRFVNY